MHSHNWSAFAKNVKGYWQKRECPGDGVYFEGMVEKCECGKMQFIPDNPDLQTVEVEL